MNIISEYFINTAHVPQEALIYLLMLPVIATLVVLARHIIGIKSFGLYIPIIATYSLSYLGLKVGLALTIYLAIIGILTRITISKFRIHYVSRLSLVICISTLASLSFIYLLSLFDSAQSYEKQDALAMILVISFCETFISTQIQKGFRTALYLFVETMTIAVIGSLLLKWVFTRELVLDFPYIIIITLIINLLIGKWKGLRLYEIWRFRTVKKTTSKKI